jgi:hypothetical protein
MNLRRIAVLVVPLAAALACESAANLDVSYANVQSGDASAETGATPDAGDPDASESGAGELGIVEGCPCDQTAGLGCCVTPNGAFCTNDLGDCTSAKGEWLRCSKRDPAFESECCWSGSGTGAFTRFAATCDGGTTACLMDADCAGTNQACNTVTCAGFTFGQCAPNAPSCPTP